MSPHSKKLFWLLTLGFLIFTLAVGSLLGYAYLSRTRQKDNCLGVKALRNAVVLSYRDALKITQDAPIDSHFTKHDKKIALQFYTRNIRKLEEINCT